MKRTTTATIEMVVEDTISARYIGELIESLKEKQIIGITDIRILSSC